MKKTKIVPEFEDFPKKKRSKKKTQSKFKDRAQTPSSFAGSYE